MLFEIDCEISVFEAIYAISASGIIELKKENVKRNTKQNKRDKKL